MLHPVAGFSEQQLREKAEEIRLLGRQYGLSASRIDQCFKTAVKDLIKDERRCWRWLLLILLLIIASYCLLASHKPTQTFVSRNIQDLIYPSMRLLRLTTLWLHQRFPQITGWHEEQCLIDNPWYRNLDVSCWPCEQIRTVTNLTAFPSYVNVYLQNGIPFVIHDERWSAFSLERLETLYTEQETELVSGTGYFRSNIPSLKDIKDVFEPGKSSKLYEYNKIHIEWRLRRFSAAHVMRGVFPRPHFVPKNTEVALERYLFIDGPSSLSYTLPLTEFANVWLTQEVGRRVVTFQPSPHCHYNCSPISTVIFAGDTLYYNWQYWRPRFHPSATSLSLTYMGSFY